MQCLFCGKELALLKRLRGGGEFCSEAHRKEYQEQYEQLALARLLQAKPPAEQATSRPSAVDPRLRGPPAEVPAPVRPEPQIQQRRAVAMIEAAMIEAPAPRPSQPAEQAGPAPLAGFVDEPLVPAVTTFQHTSSLELAHATAHGPSLPAVTSSTDPDSRESLPPAPRVEFEFSLQALDHHTRMNERGMELREFAAPPPVMEMHLRPDRGTEPAGAADVMEILMSPHPPQKPTPWLEPSRGFPAAPAELGPLARLDFATSGFAYSDGPVSSTATIAQAPTPAPEPVHVLPPPEPQPEPQFEPPGEPAPPALVTAALPVTLHGLAAPRGKFVQGFPSAMVAASDVQLPRSAALPLRPVIVFGPAPVAPPTQIAAPAVPAQRMPAEPKPVQAKSESSLKSSVVPLPKAVPVKRPAAPQVSAPAAPVAKPRAEAPVQEPVASRVETRVEPRVEQRRQEVRAFQPVETTAPSESAFPSLELKATESAWSKLSTGLKIGIAAAVIVGLCGIGYIVTRGSGKSTSQAPVAVEAAPAVASGVPISGGWIDDWANTARPRRHISVLSGSAKLSDYRLEFQAQIQTKAIGWIFRGLNPRNYYVTKLEVLTPGLEPTVGLVHFAVVDGQDENRVVVPLPMKVRVDTTYKVRFEAIGNHFTTWLQGQKIAEWTDSRFGSGGVGLFSERDEQAAMQGTLNVVALVPKN